MENKTSCGTAKAGEIYACKSCGFEVEVKKPCNCGDDCAVLECCGAPLEKK